MSSAVYRESRAGGRGGVGRRGLLLPGCGVAPPSSSQQVSGANIANLEGREAQKFEETGQRQISRLTGRTRVDFLHHARTLGPCRLVGVGASLKEPLYLWQAPRPDGGNVEQRVGGRGEEGEAREKERVEDEKCQPR